MRDGGWGGGDMHEEVSRNRLGFPRGKEGAEVH